MITAAVIGASGYSGAELLRLLANREDMRVEKIFANTAVGKRVEELYPAFSGSIDLEFEPFDPDRLRGIDVVFIALPSGEAMDIVPRILAMVEYMIDLGGDFRLQSTRLYEQYYNRPHRAPHLLNEAVYGLPELYKDRIARAKLVANPGCYPTSAILALAPALKHRIISSQRIAINALSGVSGAGRSASLELSFAEMNENIRAYKVGTHQHIPEIDSILTETTGETVSVSFVPHVVPMTRGIYTTIYADLQSQVKEEDLIELYRSFYCDAPFVRVKQHIPQIKDVANTNFCDIAFVIERRTNQLILFSALDNLLKGAAGQAVQNMNIMLGFHEEKGLSIKESVHVS